MPDLLDAFFAANAERPWSWGDVDCAMALADWAMSNGHPDPFSEYRGTYDSEAAFKALVVPRGGTLSIITGLLLHTRIAPVDRPSRGVIAVIGSGSHPLRQWGAIHDGTRWQVRTHEGFTTVAARPLSLWSV